MRIGMIMDSLSQMSFTDALDAAAKLGVQSVEVPTGNWSTAPHVDLPELVASATARRQFADAITSRGLAIEALNASGNQLHPKSGEQHDKVVHDTMRVAGELGVTKIVMMSGLPAAPGDSQPNWITTCWPAEVTPVLEWQWNEVAIPYWHDLVEFARAQGIKQIALELHPNQLVFNVRTVKRLRAAVGDIVGANMDPSHLMWMGADPLRAIDALGGAIFHVHAKDTRIAPIAAVDSLYETLPWEFVDQRAWNYVTLGRGHTGGAAWWRSFVEHLRGAGYDGVLSIEHEDVALSQLDGVTESVELLKSVLA